MKAAIKVIIWICGLIAQLIGTVYVYDNYGFWLAVLFFFIGGFGITLIMGGLQWAMRLNE